MQFVAPTEEEYVLIFDSWARSYKKSPFAGTIPNHLWDKVARECAAELLTRSHTIVAIPDDGPRRVMGYSVAEPGVLHWLYVKRDYRRIARVGSRLLQVTTDGWSSWEYSHRTTVGDRFLRASGLPWRWNPVRARVKGE